jgi:glycine hydroxymethyltransferase
VTGGTDNHLLLLDLTPLGVLGKPAAQALARAGIVCNYNTIPFDKNKPFNPSGLRLGTPAITTRGLGTAEMPAIAAWMGEVVRHLDDEARLGRIRAAVAELLSSFPAPGIDDV